MSALAQVPTPTTSTTLATRADENSLAWQALVAKAIRDGDDVRLAWLVKVADEQKAGQGGAAA